MTEYVRNTWYAAAWKSELGDTPFKRRILGEPIVMFLKSDGSPAALIDRCPHRLAPLSFGECTGDFIRCAYHGMEFDADGKCTNIPGQDVIPPTAKVQSFPVVERYGMIWIWMGEAAQADESKLPTIKRFDTEGWEVLSDGYQCHNSGYINIVENLMDPAHTTFLHKQTIGNPAAKNEPVKVEGKEDHVVAYRWLTNTKQSPFDKSVMSYDGDVDRAQFFYYFPPSLSLVEICSMPSGQEHIDQNMDKGLRTFSYKFLTPEDDNSTHFFWLHVRNYKLGDQEWVNQLLKNLDKTYQEDHDIVAAIQHEQEVTGRRQFTGLAIDRAPALASKMIDKMIADEAAQASQAAE